MSLTGQVHILLSKKSKQENRVYHHQMFNQQGTAANFVFSKQWSHNMFSKTQFVPFILLKMSYVQELSCLTSGDRGRESQFVQIGISLIVVYASWECGFVESSNLLLLSNCTIWCIYNNSVRWAELNPKSRIAVLSDNKWNSTSVQLDC